MSDVERPLDASEMASSPHPQAEGTTHALTDLMAKLIQVNNQLSVLPDIDSLCRKAVEAGLELLNFERLSIWLLDAERQTIHGTFGTDEVGRVRDERGLSFPWVDNLPDQRVLDTPDILYRRTAVPLHDHNHQVVGTGEVGALALWNGEEVIGIAYVDNLITGRPISRAQWRIFELYASTLGHLLSLKRTESALRSQEELLSQILDIIPVGIFVLAPGERIVQYNRAAQELWEFEPGQLDNWSPNAVWAANGRPVEKHEWGGHLALEHGKDVLHQEVELMYRDGTRRVILNSGVALRNGNGTLTGAVVVNQEITDAKRREQQLEALAHMSQALRPLMGLRGVLQTIITNMATLLNPRGVAILLLDAEGHVTIEAANGDYAPLANQVVPQEFTQAMFEDELDLRVYDAAQNVAHCPFEQLPSTPRYMVAAPLVNEDAAVGAVMIGFASMPDRAVLAMITALADVSAAAVQRGQLYDEVATQANRLERVMESVNFGLVLLDPQQRVVLTNPHVKTHMAQLGNIVVGEELQSLGGYKLKRLLAQPPSESPVHEIMLGSSIYEVSTVPIGAADAEGGWLMVIHDVTRERALQSGIQQHQRLAAVGQLAAGIAHDFNNIIAVILLYVQMIQRNPALPENDQDRLNVIREQAQNASRLIRQILDFSRQTLIDRQRVDLLPLIQGCLDLWRRTLPESIHFHFEVQGVNGAPLESAFILAEANSIQQALTNLAVNARDAMPAGGEITLALRALNVHERDVPPVAGLNPGTWFEITVTDNGEGIPPEHLPHVFDPFFTTKEVGKGTGLGLAQVYGIVQQHGGVVTAHSEPGKGTSFSLWLPAWQGEQSAGDERELPEMSGTGSETILLVEDNGPAREATSALLAMLGYRVMAATNGREALSIFQRYASSIQLIVSDVVMPEMGGLELYKHVIAIKPTVSMLMMTGYPLEQEQQWAATVDSVEWLQKPFSVKELTAVVRRMLARTSASTDDDEANAG